MGEIVEVTSLVSNMNRCNFIRVVVFNKLKQKEELSDSLSHIY
jgi:hypothetical protein